MPQFKKFTAETVEVSEMNDFIASQVVGTFDSVSARNAYFAGGGAFTVVEGMVTYLKDTGEFQVYKSTGWTTIGAKGDTGATGATGASGATGATGATGAAGAAASITLGAVTTGEPGSNVSITNSGSSSGAVFNFAIPRGLTGPAGPAGDKGDTGPAGPSVPPGSVVLGTDTTGDYVSTISAGTGITGSASGATSTPTIAIDTSVVPRLASANTFTTNQIISGSTTADLLRITQTGTGNALMVEDSANPDSTPLVVDAAGRLIIGHTQSIAIGGLNPLLQVHTGGVNSSMTRWVGTASGAELRMAKSRSATIGSFSAVSSADVLATINGYGDDGTAFTLAGSVAIRADAAVSTGVVPGRLEFSTANSSGTNTERMRINSAGEVGIGGTTIAGTTLRLRKNITGAAFSQGMYVDGIIQADVTSRVDMVWANSSVAASATLPSIQQFYASSAAIGAGSTVTSISGFVAESNLGSNHSGTVTNAYGFQGNLASGTNRYNLFMNGTATNFLAGRLGVGAAINSGVMAIIANTTAADKAFVVRGAVSQTGLLLDVQNSAGTSLAVIDSAGLVGVGVASPLAVLHVLAGTATGVSPGAGGRIFLDGANANMWIDIAGATTSEVGLRFGDSGSIQRGRVGYSNTNDALDFFTAGTERMRIDSAGQVGIGSSTATGYGILAAKPITGAGASYGMVIQGVIQSDVTTAAQVFVSFPSTAAASFTVGQLNHFQAAGIATPGAGSAITNQYGFHATAAMTGATNNYGFFGNIPAGTNRWNLYMGGTAANYMAGRLGVGATLTSGAMAQVTNTTAADKAFVIKGAASQTGNFFEIQNSAGTVQAVVGSDGVLRFNSLTDVPPAAGVVPELQVNGTGNEASISAARFSADQSGGRFWLVKSRNTTIGSHTTVTANDTLGFVHFAGSDGTSYVEAARISSQAEGIISTGVMPGRIVLSTADSSGSLTERVRIDSAGNFFVGMNTAATSSAKTVHLANATAPTADPTGGGVLYVESGALKYRGSSGTVTTLGNA